MLGGAPQASWVSAGWNSACCLADAIYVLRPRALFVRFFRAESLQIGLNHYRLRAKLPRCQRGSRRNAPPPPMPANNGACVGPGAGNQRSLAGTGFSTWEAGYRAASSIASGRFNEAFGAADRPEIKGPLWCERASPTCNPDCADPEWYFLSLSDFTGIRDSRALKTTVTRFRRRQAAAGI